MPDPEAIGTNGDDNVGDMMRAVLVVLLVLVVCVIGLYRASRARRDARPGAAAGKRLVDAPVAAKRALCLASILARTNLEYELRSDSAQRSGGDRGGAFLTNQRQWMETNGLWAALS